MTSDRQVKVIVWFSGLAMGYVLIVLNKGIEVLVVLIGEVDVVG